MTIKQFINKYGWQRECDLKPGRIMCVEIYFINSEGREDQTQMDIHAYDDDELEVLFEHFCNENGFSSDTVIGIEIIHIADNMEELNSVVL